MSGLASLIARDVRLAVRQASDTLATLFFYAATVTLVPLALGPETELLSRLAPGLVWVAALLASLMSVERLYQADHEDGTLEQLALSGYPLGLIAAAKACAHWLVTGLPLLVFTPVIAIMMSIEPAALVRVLIGLALGTPALSLIGGIGAALALGARRGGVLIALLVLPLMTPILIFGTMLADPEATGVDPEDAVFLLAAGLAAALGLAPLATGAALRLALE